MSAKQTLWLLRLGLPFATFGTALLCGQSVSGSLAILGLTAGIIALSLIELFGFIGIVFGGIAGLYAPNAERSLHEPDTTLFLVVGIAATLLTASLLATFLKS